MERAPFLDAGDFAEKSYQTSWTAKVKRLPLLATVAATIVAVVIFANVLANIGSTSLSPADRDASHVLGPHNETLGFGAVLLLSLPERTDRQDAVSLISSDSGIRITKTIYSVRGENVSTKARPYGGTKLSPPYLGSWRTHMNALRYVVDERIETALLLEDDVDWSMFLFSCTRTRRRVLTLLQ